MADALLGYIARFQTLADGSYRIWLDVPEGAEDALGWLTRRGQAVGLAPLSDSAPARQYGEQAKALRQSSFFRSPAVWALIGSDEDFQQWVRRQGCVICGKQDWVEELGEGRCEFAHVRRAGDSGTAHKARYAGVPLCHTHHQLQHQQGEQAAVSEVLGPQATPEQAKWWFDAVRIETVERWGWERLKAQLGYAHWNEVPPEVLREWAEDREVVAYLPAAYRE